MTLGEHAPANARSIALAWLALGGVLVVGGPLFVAMPLTCDAAMYDVQARVVANGGVLYRDVVEPNLPGAAWLHVAIRRVIGRSSEALRLFDLGVFAGVVLLLATAVRRSVGTSSAVWTSVWLFVAYFSFSEWCHCQRDTWMLLPAAAAMHLRARQWARLVEAPLLRLLGFGFLEGLAWGLAFWLKPHVAVPALACLVVTAAAVRSSRRVAYDWLGVLLGGAVVGAVGVLVLVRSGAWPWFWEMLTVWNPEYVRIGRSRWTLRRVGAMFDRLQPWMSLHLVAVPVALTFLERVLNRRRHGEDFDRGDPRTLLAALYLGWLLQAMLLQHTFDYVQAPPLLLAIALLGCVRLPEPSRNPGRLVVAGFAGLVVLSSPLCRLDRLACWPRAITEGSTPAVRDRLAIVEFVGWREMAEIERFLVERVGPQRSGVIFYNGNLVHFYAEGRFTPTNRFVYLQPCLRCFPGRHDVIREAILASEAEYVVTSMVESGLSRRAALAEPGDNTPPPDYVGHPEIYPWTYPVVFRAGRYLVHRVTGAAGRLSDDIAPLETPPLHRPIAATTPEPRDGEPVNPPMRGSKPGISNAGITSTPGSTSGFHTR